MKNIASILFLILLLAAGKSSGSAPTAERHSCVFRAYAYSTSRDSADHEKLLRNMQRYHRMKTTGAVLTGVGGGLFVVGEVLLWTGFAQAVSQPNDLNAGKALMYPGYAVTFSGIGLLVPGIIMLSRGNKHYKRLRQTQGSEHFDGVILK